MGDLGDLLDQIQAQPGIDVAATMWAHLRDLVVDNVTSGRLNDPVTDLWFELLKVLNDASEFAEIIDQLRGDG